MLFFKKMFAFLWRYILGIIIAILSCGFLALIFKLALITVQGPTVISQLSDVVVFYVVLSATYFYLFRNYEMKQSLNNLKEFSLYIAGIIFLHGIIIVSAKSWSALWLISSGTLTFTKLMYTGGINRLVESYTQIPKMYYYIALAIEDVCFIVFSILGYCNGISRSNSQ